MNWAKFWPGCGFVAALAAAGYGVALLITLNPPLLLALIVLALIIGGGLMAAKFGLPWE